MEKFKDLEEKQLDAYKMTKRFWDAKWLPESTEEYYKVRSNLIKNKRKYKTHEQITKITK